MPDRKKPWENPEYKEAAQKYQQYGKYPGTKDPRFGYEGLGAEGPARAPEDEGEKFFANWFRNPETKDRLKRQLGLSDEQVESSIARALEAERYDVHESQLEGGGQYDPGAHEIQVADPGALPHELVHASGIDDALGNILLEKIGKPQSGRGPEGYRRYISKPGELYGNFFDIRSGLNLEPGDWVTPELLLDRYNQLPEGSKNREDLDDLLKYYSIEQISEGLDQIASVEADSERLERLNFTPDDAVISRPTNLYT